MSMPPSFPLFALRRDHHFLSPFSLCGLTYRPRQPNFLTRFAAVLRLQKLFRDCFSWREKHILIPPRSRSLVSVCLSLPAREKGGKTPLQSSTWLVFKDAFSHHLEKSLSVNLPYHAIKQWYLKTEKANSTATLQVQVKILIHWASSTVKTLFD